MNKKLLYLFILAFCALSGTAQTYVSGGIYANTNWTVSGSPYIVTGDLVLFPNFTLTIEPGVVVKFNDGIGFEVRGNLISNGTVADSILFISSSSQPTPGIWNGIFISNNVGGQGSFRYTVVRYSDQGIWNECCRETDTLFVRNSLFERNLTALGGYGGDYAKMVVDSCSFLHNDKTIIYGDKVIRNSAFIYNNYGLYNTERTSVFSSNFCGNRTAILGTWGQMVNTIVMNNGIGVMGSIYGDFYINTGNVIANNDTGVILKEGYIGANNVICNNNYFNLVSATSQNMTIINQCWCDTDSANIAAKILDGRDNPQLGLVDFVPYLNCDGSAVPDTNICPQIPAGISPPFLSTKLLIKNYPNPFKTFTTIEFDYQTGENYNLTIYNSLGQPCIALPHLTSGLVKIGRAGLPKGFYYCTLQSDTRMMATLKIVIE